MPPNDIAEAIRELREDLNDRHAENVTRHDVTDKKVDEAIRRIDDLHKAFPGGDWDGHRRYHEAVIRRIEERGKFYQDLRTELATKGIWALITAVLVMTWFYIKSKLAS